MKKNLIIIAFFALTNWACNSTTSTESTTENSSISTNANVNFDSSVLTWKGEMLGLYGHEGTIGLNSADLAIENGVVKSGSFEVNMTTINPTDDGYNEENTPEKLVGHLSSDDFFNIEQFPTATFNVTSATSTEVKGDLTVRGITHEETIEDVAIINADGITTVTGHLVFDRSKYDIKFKGAGEKVLSNDIELAIKLVLE